MAREELRVEVLELADPVQAFTDRDTGSVGGRKFACRMPLP